MRNALRKAPSTKYQTSGQSDKEKGVKERQDELRTQEPGERANKRQTKRQEARRQETEASKEIKNEVFTPE